MTFNDDETRDDHGRWTSGGGSGVSSEKPSRIEALSNYVDGSFTMNSGLREGRELTPDEKKQTESLDALIASSEPLKAGTLYRAIPKEMAPAFKKDGRFEDKAFISTSKSREAALSFINDSQGDALLVQIRVPQGTSKRGADVNRLLGHDHSMSYQHEVLLGRGNRFYVEKVTKNEVHLLLMP